MALSDYNFKPDYNKIEDNIAKEFYLPAMRNSVAYDRVSGYFGSTIYIIAWSALQQFVDNGGKIRLICSPHISEEDKIALSEGYSAKNDTIIQESLMKEMDEMFSNERLNNPSRVLACLVASGVMDVKIAVALNGCEPDINRLFHDKVGIFTDTEKNAVGFRGSMNETYMGLSDDGNSESIDVFPSWTDRRDTARVNNATKYFNKLWEGSMENTAVFDFSDAVKKRIIHESEGYDWRLLTEEIKNKIYLNEKWKANKGNAGKTPRKHQIEALENWEKNNYRGIFEHATGSGKTYTAICAIRNALDRNKSVIVLVPSKELLYQWKNEICDNITDKELNILMCGDGNDSWKKDGMLRAWTSPSNDMHRITIAMMDTARSKQFVRAVYGGEHLLLVADEVHRLGSEKRRTILEINAQERLGLSATPIRYGDEEGTNAILKYFGGILEPKYTLEDAIKDGVLTKYYYYPLKVELTDVEQEKWDAITKVISRMIAAGKYSDADISNYIKNNESLKLKIIERARIVKQAEGKIKLASDVIKEYYRVGQRWIIYCDCKRQLRIILNKLLKEGYNAYEYYAEMEGDREQTLNYFRENGGILVSIKCLDEGVDIPAATHALILASSKNPREFIQRRGRILRRFEGKYSACLYDAIVVPSRSYVGSNDNTSIIDGEITRAIQFGKYAENKSCINELRILAMLYGIDYTKIDEGYEYEERERE